MKMASNVHEVMAATIDVAAKRLRELTKRIYIPLTATSPAGLVEADTVDPWDESGKYGRAWTWFALCMMGSVIFVRIWHFWQDKIRQAIYKQEVEEHYRRLYNVDISYAMALHTGHTAQHFFPENEVTDKQFRPKAHFSSVSVVNDTLALFRWIFYRPIPDIVWKKRRFTFSSLAVLTCIFVALAYVSLYCFLQQPLYWQSIRYGSPPVAIRAGMFGVALVPWIIATSMKANILSLLTGIGPERLNVFHRWLAYLCLFCALVHAIPFYIQPVWDDDGMSVFRKLFPRNMIIYGTGIACLVPLAWLCVFSIPFFRRLAYEVFVALHIPVAMVFIAVMFWHTKNFLMSWSYLESSVAIWVLCYLTRLLKLNWTKPWRSSFLVGDEAAVTLMAENAIKITIPTQMRWKPGQHVYLRMPAMSILDNHPFTISSLCSEDFPSEYGEKYRDCTIVFKPYGGFTRKVLDKASELGPFHTYRAFLDGPYGGMTRDLAAFDTCILIAGGSGVTSLMSQLLNLIKRMRDGKAITRKVVVVWSVKRLEAMDWFREELRICRESAPPESVTCKFFITSGTPRQGLQMTGPLHNNPRQLITPYGDKSDGFLAGIAPGRNSALIHAAAQGDAERELELRAEDEDRVTALPPQQHQYQYQYQHWHQSYQASCESDYDCAEEKKHFERFEDAKNYQHVHVEPIDNSYSDALMDNTSTEEGPEDAEGEYPVRAPELAHLRVPDGPGCPKKRPATITQAPPGFDFGIPETPSTALHREIMQDVLPASDQVSSSSWSIDYIRPNLGSMLQEWATGGSDGRGILGRRTAVFVCGPPAMRVGVANTVARLQAEIWGDDELEEIFLHTENYAL